MVYALLILPHETLPQCQIAIVYQEGSVKLLNFRAVSVKNLNLRIEVLTLFYIIWCLVHGMTI